MGEQTGIPKASVIIRAKNEEKHLGQVLEKVFSQTINHVEVLVIDSGSTDRTVAIAESFPARVMQIPADSFSFGAALNFGYRRARGEILVNLSAHAVPTNEHWLESLLGGFEDESVAAVTGGQVPPPNAHAVDRAGVQKRFIPNRLSLGNSGPLFFSNTNSAVRRVVWEKFPFAESIFAEDVEWHLRVVDAGYRVIYEPQGCVFHGHGKEPIRSVFFRGMNCGQTTLALMPGTREFSLPRLLGKLVLGTLYDWWLLAKDGIGGAAVRGLFWWTLKRRFALFLGRFLLTHKGVVALGKRLSKRASSLSEALVRVTGKSSERIHPKHLVESDSAHYWYRPYLRPEDSVLDLGCAQGVHSLACAGLCRSVVAVDYNPDKLQMAEKESRRRRIENVEFCQRNITKGLDLGKARFDRILLLDVLEHVDARDKVLASAYDLLKDDGLLLVAVPNKGTTWKKVQEGVGLPSFDDPDHKVEYTLSEICAELRRNGFQPDRQVQYIVYDTPLTGLFDLVGGISLRAYARLQKWKRDYAAAHPSESTGFRLVARKDGCRPL